MSAARAPATLRAGANHAPRDNGCERLPICNAPFFGYRPTCWHEWPSDWPGCPPTYIQSIEVMPENVASDGAEPAELPATPQLIPQDSGDEQGAPRREAPITDDPIDPMPIETKEGDLPTFDVSDATPMSSAKSRQDLVDSTAKSAAPKAPVSVVLTAAVKPLVATQKDAQKNAGSQNVSA
jgi:hypothetical protein